MYARLNLVYKADVVGGDCPACASMYSHNSRRSCPSFSCCCACRSCSSLALFSSSNNRSKSARLNLPYKADVVGGDCPACASMCSHDSRRSCPSFSCCCACRSCSSLALFSSSNNRSKSARLNLLYKADVVGGDCPACASMYSHNSRRSCPSSCCCACRSCSSLALFSSSNNRRKSARPNLLYKAEVVGGDCPACGSMYSHNSRRSMYAEQKGHEPHTENSNLGSGQCRYSMVKKEMKQIPCSCSCCLSC